MWDSSEMHMLRAVLIYIYISLSRSRSRSLSLSRMHVCMYACLHVSVLVYVCLYCIVLHRNVTWYVVWECKSLYICALYGPVLCSSVAV